MFMLFFGTFCIVLYFLIEQVRATQVHSVADKIRIEIASEKEKTLETVFELAVCVRLITKIVNRGVRCDLFKTHIL